MIVGNLVFAHKSVKTKGKFPHKNVIFEGVEERSTREYSAIFKIDGQRLQLLSVIKRKMTKAARSGENYRETPEPAFCWIWRFFVL